MLQSKLICLSAPSHQFASILPERNAKAGLPWFREGGLVSGQSDRAQVSPQPTTIREIKCKKFKSPGSSAKQSQAALQRFNVIQIGFESVRKGNIGLHSFLNMSLMEARRRKGLSVEVFPVLDEPSASAEPCEGLLDDPSLRQDEEALGLIGTLDDFDVHPREDFRDGAANAGPL